MPPVCPRCGLPQSSGLLCPDCVGRSFEIDAIRSPFRFEGTVKQAVYQLKYRNLRSISPLLAGFLGSFLAQNPIHGDVLVPVPLHRKRLRERGYNQSILLARHLGRLSGLPVDENSLIRKEFITTQARARNVEERMENVRTAFACNDSALDGKQVILIDDVATSGATLNACAGVLKEAGAEKVWGLALAREI